MKLFAALCITLPCLTGIAQAANHSTAFNVITASQTTLNDLRHGGFVLYMLHGNTNPNHPDRQPSIDLHDCSTQRPLTEEGRRISAIIGKQIRKAKIPVGEVISSPLCRTVDTTKAAFHTSYTVYASLLLTSNMSHKEKLSVLEATRELLSKPVPPKSNRVIVAQAQNLAEIIGYHPQPEASIIIFQPLGEKQFKYIATLTPAQWYALKQ